MERIDFLNKFLCNCTLKVIRKINSVLTDLFIPWAYCGDVYGLFRGITGLRGSFYGFGEVNCRWKEVST